MKDYFAILAFIICNPLGWIGMAVLAMCISMIITAIKGG